MAGELAGTASLPALKKVQRVTSVNDYGAKGDARQIAGGAVTASSKPMTLPSGSFTVADVGKLIFVDRAGPLNSNIPYTLRTTIATFVSATQVTLTAAATTTVTSALVSYGTNDLITIRSAITAAGTYGRVYFPGKGSVYIFDGRLTPMFAQEWFGDSIATTKLLGGAENDHGIFIEGSAAEMRGFYLHDLTLDTGNLRCASGLELYTASASTIARVRFANVTTGGWHAKIGVKMSATDEYLCNGIQFIDCEFDGYEESLESLLLFNCRDCRVVRPTFREKTVQGPVLGIWQKTQYTVIEDSVFIDCIGSAVYYSFTCEDTHIIRPFFKNAGTAIGGANQSDNGAFGEVQAKGLYIICPVCVGGTNSANAGGLSIGAVDRVEVTNPQITGYSVPIRISQGQSAGLPYHSSHVRISGGDIYDNNPTNDFHILHPGI